MSSKQIQSKVVIEGTSYNRILIKTHVLSDADDVIKTIDRYTKDVRQKGDIIAISERIIAIMQGRSFPLKAIHPGLLARTLYPFVSRHPGGIGLRSPWTMQLAIQEAGSARIIIAAIASIITKPFGLKGVFYRVAGNNVNAIDGPCDYTLPPGNTSAKLGPKYPQEVSQNLEKITGNGVVIIDSNDYGVNVLGRSEKAKSANLPIRLIFADNPMGQSDQKTPIAIVRQNSVGQ
jgi:F420-0:gamma-glutamyl ligase